MQTINFRYQLNLYWRKISLIFLMLMLTSSTLFAQARFNSISTSGQDDKILSYGFFLAGHTNYYRLKYSEAFLDPNNTDLKQIQSIVPVYTPGFSLGFLAVLRFHDQLNLLFTPKVGFYEFKTDINTFSDIPSNDNASENTIGRSSQRIVTEATMVEFPFIFKYKAQRFNNNRMFFTAGGSAMVRTKAQEEADLEGLVTTGRDFTVDFGMGFDMYFKFFKFSPEIRFSHGLNNLYKSETSDPAFADAIESLKRKSITLYLHFQ